MSEKKSTTLRHIARVTGFSLGTVSQALNNKNGVAAETRQRVLEVATELNYQARTGTEKALETIGIMVKLDTWGGPIVLNPFYSQVLTGVERECNQRDISLLYTNVEVDMSARPLNWPPRLLDQDIDGLIIVGTFVQESFEFAAHHVKKPIVLVDASAP